jgi:putative membrane protein
MRLLLIVRRLILLLVLVAPLALQAHEPHASQDIKLVPQDRSQSLQWTWDPLIVTLLAASGALYALGSARLRVTGWDRLAYAAGWTVLAVALLSPLHRLGEVLFAAHMTQHEVLMLIAAPLLVMGRPLAPYLRALPEAWRRPLGRLTAAQWVYFLGTPVVAWFIHAIVLWCWHVPYLYEQSVANDFIHSLQHFSFLFSAIIFWWTLIHGRYGRLGYGVGVLYVFSTAVHTSVLGALLTFGTQIWYPIYAGRTSLWDLTPLQDQQLGGLIMWVPAGVVFVVVGLAMFAAWLGESERRVQRSRAESLRGPITERAADSRP